jgi:hypothetical protein
MKIRQPEQLLRFVVFFLVFVAGNALWKLHAAGQPLLGIVVESVFAASVISLFSYVRKHEDI